MQGHYWRPEVAEAVGVFFLVLAGGAAILAGAGSLGISFVFGLVVAALIYALGHVSGGHFNSAITVALAATGHFPWRRVPTYIVAQLLGATLAALALAQLFPSIAAVATQPHISPLSAVLVEALATALLALVIIGVATDARAAPGSSGLAIGLAVFVGSMAFGSLTGPSMNPARSFGPALVSGQWAGFWIYIVGPFLGAIAGMGLYQWLRGGGKPGPLGSLGTFELEEREIT